MSEGQLDNTRLLAFNKSDTIIKGKERFISNKFGTKILNVTIPGSQCPSTLSVLSYLKYKLIIPAYLHLARVKIKLCYC